MKLDQIDSSSYTTDVRAKTMPECGRKEVEKVKEYYIVSKDYEWGALLKRLKVTEI